MAINFDFGRLQLHSVEQRPVALGSLLVALLFNYKQAVPAKVFFRCEPESILVVLVVQRGCNGVGFQINGKLAGRMEAMAKNKSGCRARHPGPNGFHLPGDVRPAEKLVADVKACFKGFKRFYGRKLMVQAQRNIPRPGIDRADKRQK